MCEKVCVCVCVCEMSGEGRNVARENGERGKNSGGTIREMMGVGSRKRVLLIERRFWEGGGLARERDRKGG